jgi:hypothetical protein
MSKNLLVFITHTFQSEFIHTLEKVNHPYNDLDVLVLLDASGIYNMQYVSTLTHITFCKLQKLETSYDTLSKGHTLYIRYFQEHKEQLDLYKYIWILENDVYFPKSFKEFIDKHNYYSHDLLVPEYGLRDPSWWWIQTLEGFSQKQPIGVLAVCMRFSSQFLSSLITTIDIKYKGFLEAILPHLCMEYKYTIQQFLPELCGILSTDPAHPLLRLIYKDIQDSTKNYLEDKLYHPIKL